MSAYDIVRSFAEAREDSSIAIRDGITYGAARELADEIMRLRAEAKDAARLRAKYARAVNALQDIAALKAKPKTSGREIAIHTLAMLGEPRETET